MITIIDHPRPGVIQRIEIRPDPPIIVEDAETGIARSATRFALEPSELQRRADAVRANMRHNRITLAQLAESVGVSREMLSAMIYKHRIPLSGPSYDAAIRLGLIDPPKDLP